jgi:hypothetical protein
MRSTALLFAAMALAFFAPAQNKNQLVYTSDIDHFWEAYDSIQTTTDSIHQLKLMQTLYVDRGTEGLKAFMQARGYTTESWLALVRQSQRFWQSARPATLSVKGKTEMLEKSIQRFKILYPQLREAKMYFTIGGLSSGGTTMNDMILIGSEIATGSAASDLSDLPPGTAKWLSSVFKEQSLDNIIALNIHEYVHTQQRGNPSNLLGQALKEGSCDFITELVLGSPMQNNYIRYGRLHEPELKEKFREEMFTNFYSNWLYNGSNASTVADLGYFMGYTISKSYYNQAKNKQKAISDIISLQYSDSNEVEKFLRQSGFYPQSFDKAALIKAFEEKRPSVLGIEPFANESMLVDTSVRELSIRFSKPMGKGFSINRGKGGKEADPIVGVVGFSGDGTLFTLKVNLKPGHEYEFLVTDKSFRSAEGYPLIPYTVRFRTK